MDTVTMDTNRLENLLSKIQSLRVAVAGDFTLNGTWNADMTRPGLEENAVLPARPVVRERYACGGAANVAWNLAALGAASVRCFGVVGNDWRGDLLRRILGEVGADAGDLIIDTNWNTPFSGSIVLEAGGQQQQDARLDFVPTAPPGVESEQALLERLEGSLPALDALMIIDRLPEGMITPLLLEQCNALAADYPQTLFTVDSRSRTGQFTGMVRKANRQRAAAWLFPGQPPVQISLDQLASAALHPQVDCGCPVWITLGEGGCLVISSGESHAVPAHKVPPPVDTSGAGDTFLAAATLALAAGANAVEAAQLGNLAASITIRNLGITGAATPEDLREALTRQP